MEWIKIFANDQEARLKIKPEKPQLLILHGIRICLVLYQENFYAVQDACSHNGESLSKGHINYLGEIICPWHNYRFSLKNGTPGDSSCAPLKTYAVKSDESGFFIAI